MRVEKADVGLDVVAAAEGTEFVGGAAAVDHANCFPGDDLENPARCRVMRTPGSLGAANFDAAKAGGFKSGNTRSEAARHHDVCIEC